MSDARTFVVRLRGGSYQNADGTSRQSHLADCKDGDTLALVAEPSNPHDRHAVTVFDVRGRQLGYLPSDARDASSLLRGERVSARVERLIGGPRWWHRIFGIKKHYGLLIRISKAPIDWEAHNSYRDIAQPIDLMVQECLLYERSGAPVASVIVRYEAALAAVIELNRANPTAAAHRYEGAPVNRLTMLLVREKRPEDAWRVYEEWSAVADPIGLTKAENEPLRKRMAKLAARNGSRDERRPAN